MQCASRITTLRQPPVKTMLVRLAALIVLLLSLTELSEAQLKSHVRGGFNIGMLGDTAQWTSVPQYKATIATEATAIIALRLFRDAQPTQGVYALAPLDTVIDFAEDNQLRIAGHALVWRTNTEPAWLCALPKDKMLIAMRDHIQYMIRYRHKSFYVWDVVNEALSTPVASNCWRQVIGYPEYVIAAFTFAHAVAPDHVLLRYNEHFGEANGNSTLITNMFTLFDSMPVRPDVIGVQNHLNVDTIATNGDLHLTNFRRIVREAALRNMQVHVTEMDVYQGAANNQARAAEIYRDIFNECYKSVNCTSFSTWGVYDGLSWLKARWPTAAPLLFDSNFQPKQSYTNIETIVRSHPRQGLLVSPAEEAVQVIH